MAIRRTADGVLATHRCSVASAHRLSQSCCAPPRGEAVENRWSLWLHCPRQLRIADHSCVVLCSVSDVLAPSAIQASCDVCRSMVLTLVVLRRGHCRHRLLTCDTLSMYRVLTSFAAADHYRTAGKRCHSRRVFTTPCCAPPRGDDVVVGAILVLEAHCDSL